MKSRLVNRGIHRYGKRHYRKVGNLTQEPYHANYLYHSADEMDDAIQMQKID